MSRRQNRRNRNRRLRMESLEDRRVLAVMLVQDGDQSLDAGATINVSNDTTSIVQAEMSIDVNPTNPLNLAGIVIRRETPASLDVHMSMDGGDSWEIITIDDTFFTEHDPIGEELVDDGLDGSNRADPSIVFDANGELYIAYFGTAAATSNGRVVVAHIDVDAWDPDGSDPTSAFTFQVAAEHDNLDKLHLATGPDGPNSSNQAVYVTYIVNAAGIGQQVWVAGSNDGIETFVSNGEPVDDFVAGRTLFASDPAVGPNGELYISWQSTDPNSTDDIIVDVDMDGLFHNETEDAHFGDDISVRELNTLLIGGNSVGQLSAQPERGILNSPILDVDRSGGPHHGRIYLVWADMVGTVSGSNDDIDLFLAYSDDQGENWNYHGGEPDKGDPGNVWSSSNPALSEFMPWMDIDQTSGSVNIMFLSDSGHDITHDVNTWLSTSIDGGETFFTDIISSGTSNEGPAGNSDFYEYNGLVVHGGTAHGFWSSTDTSTMPGPGVATNDLDAVTARVHFDSSTGDNTLLVSGDDVEGEGAINIKLSQTNSLFLEVTVKGTLQYAGHALTPDSIVILGEAAGDDIDLGPIVSPANIVFAPDYNRDGIVGAADYVVWRNAFGADGITPYTVADGDGDGDVDEDDYDVWAQFFGHQLDVAEGMGTSAVAPPGDANSDQIVDDADYSIWLANIGSETNLEADFNVDGIVNFADLAVWQDMKGLTTLEAIDGDLNDDGVVDTADEALIVTQQDQDDWEANFGMIHAKVWPEVLNGESEMSLEIPDQAPHVVEVAVHGSGSVHPKFEFSGVTGSGEQLRSVPVGGLDTIEITFSEEVLGSPRKLIYLESIVCGNQGRGEG